ncbi:MAG: hypothetical protein IKU94_07970 [Bacteroidaceae bacterium]|nr:hypothetical protein [Bacteroidaceae bacterium]
MSIYFPQYKEQSVDAMPNCLCGDDGRNRNERECFRRGGCRGCGFDRDEYLRRLDIIRNKGMQPVTTARMADLIRDWSVNPYSDIIGLRVGKKKRAAKSEN